MFTSVAKTFYDTKLEVNAIKQTKHCHFGGLAPFFRVKERGILSLRGCPLKSIKLFPCK